MQKEAAVFVIRLQRNLIIWKIISWILPIIFYTIVGYYVFLGTSEKNLSLFTLLLILVSFFFYFCFIKRDIIKIKKNISEIAKKQT